MKSSFNRRALRLLTIVALLSGLVIVALFFFVARNQIKQRAENTLLSFTAEKEPDRIGPEVYDVNTAETGDPALTGLEQALLDDYEAHAAGIPNGKVRLFQHDGYTVYFLVRKPAVEKKSEGIQLLYTDVSFTVDLVRIATLIMSLVVAGLSVLLCFVEHYTVKQLDKKDRSLKDFFANASHELKTPLMAIRGNAEGLQAGLIEPEKAGPIIIRESERMAGLVSDILEISKLDSGTVRPHLENNDVREILYDAIQTVEPSARLKGIEIIPDLPEPAFLACDEDMLFSAFSNILTNSIRYAKSRITITLKKPTASSLTVCIANDGQPIAAEDQAHLFERFYQGPGGQSGIGMALSQEYVHLHQGTIRVFSEEGMTAFCVFL